ncbi:UNVERIFIED_CONTAM: hypothetical protein PYX00_002006 [Menopon gallinae]|uniref:Mitogen-activated protein kinase-binding protein 1 n=1 Tax=Menopon gallinae TaxID=328185 RepID=A0AAW2IEY3_9NEOP
MDSQSNEFQAPASKVIRMPSLKRGRDDVPLDDRVKLERVLGLTVGSNAALDCDSHSEQVAYPAGCTVVLFNVKKNKQAHILNTSRKTITCLAFSPGGKYLATGECGHSPSLRIWNVQDGTQIAEFQGHKYGINCVAFSPNNKYVVSVGSQHDMIVNVWDWKSNIKVASNKVSTRVKAVSFSENGKYFVTVGMRHVKFWYLEYSRSSKYNEPVPLMGRSGILGEQRDNYFCDVACGRGAMGDSTYAITKSGLLCEFNIRRLLDKWVELRTRSANCMTVGEYFIFIGCADGIIRCFSPDTLQFLVTLPRTHYLGVDVSLGLDINHLLTHPPDAKYPDAIALAYDEVNRKLTCVYNDHSLYVWDVNDIRRVGKSHSFLYHSACIWGVEMYPEFETQDPLPVPAGSFITCSSDDTIRVWNLNNLSNNNPTVYRRNIYSNELLKVLYIDPELTYLKDLDLTTSSSEKTDTSYDGKNGVRSVRISPDGQHLASGDRKGNIRIHELKNLQQNVMIEAHDAEVLCLEYSKDCSENLLASASRDRLIHVFDVSKGYECMQTLDDHSSSITSVRFIHTRGQLQMVSCSADKSIIFRQFHPETPGGAKQFVRDHNVAGKTTLYDMEVDCGQKHIMTACQDRNIRIYNVNSGKHSKTFKGSTGEDGTLIKVSLDNSGIYVATSCTDKSLSIYDYYSGECMAAMLGHSELVTGLRFTNDCKRLISASGDGCIFIWKLPRDMVVTMQARLDQQAVRKGKRTVSLHAGLGFTDGPELISDDEPESLEPETNSIDKTGFRFSISKLPAWARREIEDPNKSLRRPVEVHDSPEQPVNIGFSIIKVNKPPQGRWAQRIESNEIMIGTFSPDKQKNINEPNSKDSSLESHNERTEDDLKTKELQGNEGIGFDGDVEDSDVEMETHYYPTSNENSEFTVNANNIEELRRSTRRYKKQQMLKKSRPNSLNLDGVSAMSNPGTSVSGSQDSDDDDLEDISSETETPSIERSLGFNVNSVSTESLDLVGQRENYFKNNFESMNVEDADNRKDLSGKSITSQYHVRNTAVINAAKQTKTEIEKTKKREELKKRLEDTRRTLQISGLTPSPLKTSQSICDLSRFPDQRISSSKRNFQSSQDDDSYDEEGLRRAISLSDLSASPTPQSSQTQIAGKGAAKPNQNGFNNAKVAPRTQSMVRCSSVGVLNRMDPELDLNSQASKKFGNAAGKGLMRPTISSQNKVTTSTNVKINNSGLAKRRTSAFSSVNLTTVGVNDDSSSEENGFARQKERNNANAGQRRQSNLGRYGSLKDISHKAKEVTQRLTSTTIPRKNKNQEAEKEAQVDVAAAPLTKQLCSSITSQLSQDVDNLLILHKRLTIEGDKTGHNRPQMQQMAEDLEKLAIETQQKLNTLTSKLKNNNAIIKNQLSTNPSNFLGNNLGLIMPNNCTSAPSYITGSNNPNLMANVDVSRLSEMLMSMVHNHQNSQK